MIWVREIANFWHWMTRDHKHLTRANEEMIICQPRRYWIGRRHYLYSKDGAEWIEVTRAWLTRLLLKEEKAHGERS